MLLSIWSDILFSWLITNYSFKNSAFKSLSSWIDTFSFPSSGYSFSSKMLKKILSLFYVNLLEAYRCRNFWIKSVVVMVKDFYQSLLSRRSCVSLFCADYTTYRGCKFHVLENSNQVKLKSMCGCVCFSRILVSPQSPFPVRLLTSEE